MEEVIFTLRWRKWSKDIVRYQMDNHCLDDLQPWSYENIPSNGDIGTQLC
jgi:hypothetical protein